MNSIGPILEENFNFNIYIPGLSERKKINKKFMLVCCQNYSNVLGRNQLPNILKRRIKIINYPENIKNDFQNICANINKVVKNEFIKKDLISDDEAKKFGLFIQKFNELNSNIIYNLNLRDIKKLFKRIYVQGNEENNYKGFNHYYNIFFYILSQTKKKDQINLSKQIIPLLVELFAEKNKDIFLELEECLNSKTQIIEEENKKNIYLKKYKCMINANELKTLFSDKIELYQNLNSFLESLFFAKLTLKSEPLLLLGESGYKTFLSEKIISNYEIIDLILGTKINQL